MAPEAPTAGRWGERTSAPNEPAKRDTKYTITIRLRDTGLLMVLGINLVITFSLSTYISVGAHIGGLIGGGLAAFVLVDLFERVPALQSRGQTPAQRRRTTGVAGVVSILLILGFVMGSIAAANRAANSVPIGWFF